MKILVLDSQGPDGLSDTYRGYLRGVSISGSEPAPLKGQPCAPHGAWVGWLAGAPLRASAFINGPKELHFHRVFDKDSRFALESFDDLFQVISTVMPHVIVRSWGDADRDDPASEAYKMEAWKAWAGNYDSLLAGLNIVDFCASGNDDANDMDDDIDFPHRLLKNSNVIGAIRREGVPSVFSGDGIGLQCVMGAENIYVPDGSGEWTVRSGTSFAAPKAAGVCAAYGLDREEWRQFVRTYATRPSDPYALPHPKWGWGSMEEEWQVFARLLPKTSLPPAA